MSGTILQAGSVEGGVHIHQPTRRVATLPHRAGTAPSRAAAFQTRHTTQLLADILNPDSTAALTSDPAARTGVVSGLGGVGKTQIALDYAEQLWTSGAVDLVVWVTAGSREAILSSYARLAADLTGTEDTEPEHGAARLREWLASTTARWLVVLDDVQNPSDVRGLWPPAVRTGRVVVTTRRRDAALRGHGRRLIEVGVFTPAEAHAYLTTALAEQPRLSDDIPGLAAALGYLPLALAQASAYLMDRELTCTAYQRRLADRRRRLVASLPEPDGLPDEHRATVAATWSLSVEQANQLAPVGVAGPLLEVACLLDANGIPAELFTAPAVVDLLAGSLGRAVGADDARDGLGCLRRLSLMTWDEGAAGGVRIHALVQRATLDAVPAERLPVVVQAAADALSQVWPVLERDTVVGQVLRANTEALILAGERHLSMFALHPVLFRAGLSFGGAGLTAEARDYHDRLSTTANHYLGSDHPDTLAARHQFFYWSAEAGDQAGAVIGIEQLLPDQVRVAGPDHPFTLIMRSNLARVRGEAGDPAGAATAFEQLLPDQVRVLGPDHPDTLIMRNNWARFRGEAGDLAGAAVAFEQLLGDQLRVLGPDHPDTLATRHELITQQGDAGDPAGAVIAFEQLVADRQRVLGLDHPQTLMTRGNMAFSRAAAGDTAGAVTDLERLLADQMRVLGADHPHTLTTRSNLATQRGDAGDPVGAVAEFEQLAADRQRVLGLDHPQTLTARQNLAFWRGVTGDFGAAAIAFEQLVADRQRVSGPDHPQTLIARTNLARVRGRAGSPAEAVAAFEQLLTAQSRVLGADHPDTLRSRNELAFWRGQAGDPARAVTELECLLADQLRVSGPDHPATLTTRINLAGLLGAAGDPAAAVADLDRLLQNQLRAQKPQRHIVVAALNSLAHWKKILSDNTRSR